MTTGKSTIGPILSNTLGWNFYDLDEVIESKYNFSIKKLFNEKGEDEFRAIENKVLAELNPK
ncbi:MAG: shikimate kinase, partial [Bacteroidetes bacterium]|nr:shikimate kinase [Bacteroidota bacterium]